MSQGGLRPTRPSTACRAAVMMLAIALPCQACAFSYTDANGDRHTVGLVDITVHAPGAPQTFAGDVIDVASIGLTAGRTAQGAYITLGYSHEVSAVLRNNALVVGNPLHPRARPSRRDDDAKDNAR